MASSHLVPQLKWTPACHRQPLLVSKSQECGLGGWSAHEAPPVWAKQVKCCCVVAPLTTAIRNVTDSDKELADSGPS